MGRASASIVLRALFSTLVVFTLAGCNERCEPARQSDDSVGGGEALFVEHCSDCHGVDARGAGPIARGLISLPADLTRIAARRDGVFPRDEVRRTIDGRAGRPGHRGPEMPRWGEFWDASDAGPEGASAKIEAVVGYLASIQISVAQDPAPTVDERSTRERMDALSDAIEAALPAVFSDLAYSDPDHRRALADAVAMLAAEGASLEAHATGQSQTFEPLARSLARDAERTQAAFEAERVRMGRFRFGDLLENCVACHTRLPSGGDYAGLVEAVDPNTLPAPEALRLLVATRQFEAAQSRYEALLREGEPEELGRRGIIADYLIVSLRVLGDLESPRRVLAELAKRDEARSDETLRLRGWIAGLDALRVEAEGDPLARARDLLQGAEEKRRTGDPEAGLVLDIAASGHLFRFVEGDTATEPDLADAYYLLGLSESRIRRPLGRERWDDYLEAAIRLAPATPTSRAAFALYEENWLAQYEGFSVLALPRDELHRVEGLRELANLDAGAERDEPGGSQ